MRMFLAALVSLGVLAAPTAVAPQQVVTVKINGPTFSTITAGTQRGRPVTLQATPGQVIRFRVDPSAYWDRSIEWCFYFDHWSRSTPSNPAFSFNQETNYTVGTSNVELVAAYKSTKDWWLYPGCWF